jgi:hypothetical protein
VYKVQLLCDRGVRVGVVECELVMEKWRVGVVKCELVLEKWRVGVERCELVW